MSIENANRKYCVVCKQWKEKIKFAKEGKDRLDRFGEPSRRRICTACTWERRKEKSILSDNKSRDNERLLAHALIELGRHDIKRIMSISEDEFIEKTNCKDHINGLSFTEIKDKAVSELLNSGYHRPESIDLGEGTYIIVGDSHGKHTNYKLFEMLSNLSEYIGASKIIHVGHLLDDDNDINDNWNDFENFVVLAKTEEVRAIEEKMESGEFNFDVIRNEIKIGNYSVCNQDLIQDYVKTSISNIDSEIFPDSVIVNCHRHEMETRCSFNGRVSILSPGCLCENHILRTIKQIDFTSGYQVKESYPDGYIKYRRMKHMYQFWQKGMIIVHFDGDTVTCVPVRIKEIDGEYVTSYFDKIISSNGIHEPDRKIFVNGDVHVGFHDDDVLSIQSNICKDYNPTDFVTLGDTYNCSSLNHHLLDRGRVIEGKDLVQEMCQLNYILKKMGTWAKNKYLLYGNHERFLKDFCAHYPQLKNLLDFEFLSGLHTEGYNFIGFKEVLEIGNIRFIHGDMKMYGGKGRRIERASRTFKECIIGHIHSPSHRFNCYSVGLSGTLDHEYNEKNASNWMHSFILCNQYKGESFILPIAFENNKLLLNSSVYSSEDSTFSQFTTASTKLSFSFND